MKKGTLSVFSLELLADLEEQLTLLEEESPDIKEFARMAFAATNKKLLELKQRATGYAFSGVEEEIDFFKRIKPIFSGKRFYYYQLFHFYSGFPRWGRRQGKAHFKHALKSICRFHPAHQAFCSYYETGSTYLDEHYFTRGHCDIDLLPVEALFLADDSFSSSHDCMVAMILGYDQLEQYLARALERFEAKKGFWDGRLLLNWTGYKAALIELCYALYDSKVINNGKATLKNIVEGVELLFNIKLGNYSDSLDDFRIRKKRTARFLDELKDAFLKNLEGEDP